MKRKATLLPDLGERLRTYRIASNLKASTTWHGASGSAGLPSTAMSRERS